MLVTVLEARVDEGKWEALRAHYDRIRAQLPPQLVSTSLLQETGDRTLWRLATTWTGKQGLQEYRASVETPAGVSLFRELGVEPTLTAFDVVARATREDTAGASAAEEVG